MVSAIYQICWRSFAWRLGETIRGQQDVFQLLLVRIPNTVALAVTALFIALIIGFPLGFLSAYKKGSPVDTISMTAAIVGVSLPHFWLGLMLMQLFAVKLQWLPVAGQGWRNMILPALTLGLSQSAVIARLTRSSMIDILGQDFVRTARAKGLREAVVLYRHALRSGLVTVVAMLGLLFTYMLGGAVVVEMSSPGTVWADSRLSILWSVITCDQSSFSCLPWS